MRQTLLVFGFLLGARNLVAQDSMIYYQNNRFLKHEFFLYKDSLMSVNKAISLYPDSALLYFKRGCHYLFDFQPFLAKEDLKRTFALDTSNYSALEILTRMAYVESNDSLTEFYGRRYLQLHLMTAALFILSGLVLLI